MDHHIVVDYKKLQHLLHLTCQYVNYLNLCTREESDKKIQLFHKYTAVMVYILLCYVHLCACCVR